MPPSWGWALLRWVGVAALAAGLLVAWRSFPTRPAQDWSSIHSFELDSEECEALREARGTTHWLVPGYLAAPVGVTEVARKFRLETALLCQANKLPDGNPPGRGFDGWVPGCPRVAAQFLLDSGPAAADPPRRCLPADPPATRLRSPGPLHRARAHPRAAVRLRRQTAGLRHDHSSDSRLLARRQPGDRGPPSAAPGRPLGPARTGQTRHRKNRHTGDFQLALRRRPRAQLSLACRPDRR